MVAHMSILLFVVAGLLGATPAAADVADTEITFRGLVAFDLESGRVLFLSPKNDKHPPTMTFDLMKLEDGTGLLPDLVASLGRGVGLGVWNFEEVVLNRTNVVEVSLTYKEGKVEGDAIDGPQGNDKWIRWIPKMSDIFSERQTMDDAEIRAAAAKGMFPVGRLEAVFDRAANRTTRYDLGLRKCTAIADALLLTVKLKDPTKPLFKLTAHGKSADFVIQPGTPIEFAAFPLKKGIDFAHLHHLLSVRKSGKDDRPVTPCEGNTAEPGIRPIRCAPVQFP